MKKSLFVVVTIILLTISSLIGCFDSGVKTDKTYNVTLESAVVEFYNYSLKFIKDDNVVVKAQVEYLFINIAPRNIRIHITAEFYDVNNNLLGVGGPKTIELLEGYTEKGIFPANIITYEDEDAENVDHVLIKAIEI